MAKDLTTSRIDRQNILNNELAVEEIKETTEIHGVPLDDKYYLTKGNLRATLMSPAKRVLLVFLTFVHF